MSIQQDLDQTDTFALGSSVYGGRPTFALVRDENYNEVSLTLYELLPREQADARQRRYERRHRRCSKPIAFNEVIDQDEIKTDDWTWDDWDALKVRQLSGVRLRCILPLLDEVLYETDLDSTKITGTGNATILLQEEPGIQVSLGFIGVKPLRRVDRMRAFVRGVSRMSLEECYYWFAKCQSPDVPGGAKALRILLAENSQP